MDLADVSAEDFQPLVNEAFTIEGEDPLILSEVEEKPQANESGRRSFALVFSAESSSVRRYAHRSRQP